MSRLYRVQEFAELAGVTVKALYHYGRLGLLQPHRTTAGYRLYSARDLERLEQIVALKFLGIPLRQIAAVLDGPPVDLPDALRAQRQALEHKRGLLERAIHAIRAAQEAIEPGKPADPAILKRIIEAIDMQDDIEAMRKYYTTPEAWDQRRRYHEEGPSPEWRELYRDVYAALGEDPAGEQAQALADRWLALTVRAWNGDPDAQTDNTTAWMDRENWPASLKQRVAGFHLEEVHDFVQRAAWCARRKYFSAAAWSQVEAQRKQSAEKFSRDWQARVDLFRDIQAAMEEDPAGEKGRALAARWQALVNEGCAGDPEVQAGILKAWLDRRNWPATLRWQMETAYMANSEQFQKAADFLERARAFG